MRRLLTFECNDEVLAGSLDEAAGEVGVLMVTGGSQTRVGSHRMYERLAKALADLGFPCFRFDRRGVGESSGDDPGYRGSAADLLAARAAFVSAAPEVKQIVGLGLCDGATALAIHGVAAGIQGTILINPWLVEAEADAPPPTAVRAHYRERLLSKDAWRRLLGGKVDVTKLVAGVRKAGAADETELADAAALGLAASGSPVALILAHRDATAIAAAAQVKRAAFAGTISWTREIDTDSHTFARAGDMKALEGAVIEALAILVEAP